MNEKELFDKIDKVLDGHNNPRGDWKQEQTDLSIAAYQRRFDNALRELGLDLNIDVRSLHGHGYEVVVRFTSLDRKRADRFLNRLEDIARTLEEKSEDPVQVHPGQMTLF